MGKKGEYLIPFDNEGNQHHWVDPRWSGNWLPNDPFQDTLTFLTYTRGRSAAYFHFARSDGRKVCMFLTDIEAAIPHMVNGKLTGTFRFTKRGQNYGIQLQAA